MLFDLIQVEHKESTGFRWVPRLLGALSVLAGAGFVLNELVNLLTDEGGVGVSSLAFMLRALQVVVVGAWIAWRPPWRATTPAQQRQGGVLLVICLLLLVPAIGTLPLEPDPLAPLPYYLVITLCILQCFWLCRRGLVRLAAVLMTANICLQVIALSDLTVGPGPASQALVYGLVILVGGFTVSWWFGLVVAVALPLFITLLASLNALAFEPDWATTATHIVLLVTYAGLTGLYTRGLERALATADERTDELRGAQAALEARNTDLAEQAAQLQAAQEARDQIIAQQERAVAQAVAELRERSMELNAIQTPLIPVAQGVLVAPLVGAWDVERAGSFMQALLAGIERERAHTALLDLTAVTVTSDQLASMLQQLLQGTRLLGCRCVLVGVQPEAAQVLVSMGVGFDDTAVARNLAEGVSRARKGG